MVQHLTKWLWVEVSNIYHMYNGFFYLHKICPKPNLNKNQVCKWTHVNMNINSNILLPKGTNMVIIVSKATSQSGCELKCQTFIVWVVFFLHT
jgi:hypothetical protein